MNDELRQQIREGIVRSAAQADQFLAQLRQDDDLQDQLVDFCEATFRLARTSKLVGGRRNQTFSLLVGAMLSAIDGAYDVEEP